MDKEHVKGAIDNAVGKTKEAVGHVVDSKKPVRIWSGYRR
jgi:uncharacterized protein YjbJ (UPF0337 family)